MPPTNIESDPFFVQLTDALRAGPGSSQWQQAIAVLRERGAEGADEYHLLTEARESLEAGREYRAVRAGPEFTRKLMGEIESRSVGGPRSAPTATLIAVLCGLLLLAGVGYMIYRSAPHELSTQQQVDDLSSKSQRFFDTVVTATFTGAIPEGWRTIGSLPLEETDGLRPVASPPVALTISSAPPPEIWTKWGTLGGGVVWNGSLQPSQAFAVDVSVRAAVPTKAVLLEAFVSTDKSFSPDKGTSSHDLVWQLRVRDQQVLLSGGSQHLIAAPAPFGDGDSVRLIVDQNVAIVEVTSASTGKSQRLWSGSHDLPAGPRYVGVRFLQTGVSDQQDLSVSQIKITTSPG